MTGDVTEEQRPAGRDSRGRAPSNDPAAVGSPRRALDQLSILNEAIKFIDEDGLTGLTMRQLGARLGVEAMALYRYVPGREQLLDGVVEVVMDELYLDTMEPTSERRHLDRSTSSSWRTAYARLALAHPRVFPLVATRPPAAPWLRPPLRSLRWVEAFLEGLRHYGFSGGSSVWCTEPSRPSCSDICSLETRRSVARWDF